MSALIIAIVLTLTVSGFCSLLEAFFLSTTTAEIEDLKITFPRQGNLLDHFKKELELTNSAILTLNTIANTMGAALVGALALNYYPAWVAFITGGLVLGILFLSEILPKNMGVLYRKSLGKHLVYPLYMVRFTMYPFSFLAMHSIRLMVRGRMSDQATDHEKEILLLADKSARDGSLTTSERDMISNALTLDDVHIGEIMTPRTVVTALDTDRTVGEVMREHKIVSFARMPLYDGNIDKIVGQIRRRDLLRAFGEDRHDQLVGELKVEILFIPDSAVASDALQLFLQRHQQMAVVVDEFGSTVGVVTMEDVIEHILGREIYEDSDIAVDMRELARRQARKSPGDADASGTEQTRENPVAPSSTP